jgi:pimeloyl-ACP methyl ester carboxylesterase
MRRSSFAIAIFIFIFLCCYVASAQGISEKDDWFFWTDDKTTQIYVYEFGRGESFVVLHGGFGAEHSYLLDAIVGLEDMFHFVFYDQRGSLLSPTKPENISVQKHLDDIDALRRALGLERINLIGHSQGTRLAMRYLQEHPDKVGKIVLIGAVYPKGGKYLDQKEKDLIDASNRAFSDFMARPQVVEVFRQFGMPESIARMSSKTKEEQEAIGNAFGRLSAKQQAQLDKVSFASANVYYIERWNQMKWVKPFFQEAAGSAAFRTMEQDFDFRSGLKNHRYPITVINGTHEQSDFGNHRWKHVLSELKNIEMIVIDKAGHNIWIDQPGRFRKALRQSMSRKIQ